MQVRTLKHKKSSFCMYVDERMLRVLKHCLTQSYPVSRRVIGLSGDVEENPGPSCQFSTNANFVAYNVPVAN